MKYRNAKLICVVAGALGVAFLGLNRPLQAHVEPTYQNDFSRGAPRLESYLGPADVQAREGRLTLDSRGDDVVLLAPGVSASDAVATTRIMLEESPRRCFGLALRATPGGEALAVRYYDQSSRLQLLQYDKEHRAHDRGNGERIPEVRPGWYQMKAAVVGAVVMAKLWPEGEAEPAWQLRVNLKDDQPYPDDDREVGPHDWVATADRPRPFPATGQVGIVRHDATAASFDRLAIWTDGPVLDQTRHDLRAGEQATLATIRTELRLCLAPANRPVDRNGRRERHVTVALAVDHGRAPLGLPGTLTVVCGEEQTVRELRSDDWQRGLVEMVVPEPADATEVSATLESSELERVLRASSPLEDISELTWHDVAQRCVDQLMARGTDRYGNEHLPVLMSLIDVKTLTAPQVPYLYDGYVRTEGRRHRRSEGGSNLWNDQALLRAFYRLSETTGDEKYAQAADDYYKSYLERAINPTTNLLIWGSHSYYDAFADGPGGDRFTEYGDRTGEPVHEILIRLPIWEAMYRVDPGATRREIEAIWQWHINDKSTGVHNRHDSPGAGDFSFSGGTFALAFAFLHEQTGDSKWLDRAKLVADYHYEARNRQTNLAMTAPASAPEPRTFNGHFCTTQLVGPFAAQMLRVYEITGDRHFLEIATTFIKAYDRYGWDDEAETYWGALRLDGTPLRDKSEFHNYGWAPDGHVDMWKTIIYSWEFPVAAAQASIYAWEVSATDPAERDPELLAIAQRWARAIEGQMPPRPGRRFEAAMRATLPEVEQTAGTYAENYARAISFFVHLYRASGNERHRQLAEQLAQEAVEKLYDNGLFKGHPAKPYYDALDGSGFLVWALLELGDVNVELPGAF